MSAQMCISAHFTNVKVGKEEVVGCAKGSLQTHLIKVPLKFYVLTPKCTENSQVKEEEKAAAAAF